MRSIKPLGDQVLVELIEDAKQTAGGIVIPDSVTVLGSVKRGRVIELGEYPFADDRKNRRPWPIKLGEFVLVRNGIDVKIGVWSCQLVKREDVIATFEE